MQDDILVDVCKSAKQIFQSETDFENTWIRYLEDAGGLYWFHNSHWLVRDLNPKKYFEEVSRKFGSMNPVKYSHLENYVILTFLS